MTRKFDARLKAAEQRTAAVSKFAPVCSAIRNHLFYDELPEDLRDRYCEFIGIDRGVMEHIMLTALGDLHFVLRDIERPTPEELKEIIAEVEQMVNDSEELET